MRYTKRKISAYSHTRYLRKRNAMKEGKNSGRELNRYPCKPLAASVILVSLCSRSGKRCKSTDEDPDVRFTSTSHAQP